jgi:aminoglycoside phosphotransferase (APT) family kinase protein
VAAAISRLHGDAELAQRLSISAVTCRDSWSDTFQDRFDADLAGLRRTRPPVASDDVMDTLVSLVEGFRRDVASHAAFDEAASACVHGDLWRNNILIGPGSRVTILDWDDLAVGDPALDWAMLLGFDPARENPDAVLPPPVSALSPASRLRFDVYRRATVLDNAIDSLSDWVDAVDAPHVMDSARAYAERTHRAAWQELSRLGLVPGSLAATARPRHIPPPSSAGHRDL